LGSDWAFIALSCLLQLDQATAQVTIPLRPFFFLPMTVEATAILTPARAARGQGLRELDGRGGSGGFDSKLRANPPYLSPIARSASARGDDGGGSGRGVSSDTEAGAAVPSHRSSPLVTTAPPRFWLRFESRSSPRITRSLQGRFVCRWCERRPQALAFSGCWFCGEVFVLLSSLLRLALSHSTISVGGGFL
jgi:hypothetical protein